MALLVRRYKRLVPLAILVFIISVLVINTHRRHNERITGRKLLARDMKNHRTGVVQRIREVSQAPLSLQVDEVGYEELDEEGDDSFERIYDEYQEASEYDTDDTPSEAQVRNESEDSNSQIDEPDNNNNDSIDDNYEPLPETEDCREIFSLDDVGPKILHHLSRRRCCI